MSAETVIAVLNELLAAEQQALAPRLFESTPFVSSASVSLAQLADRMRAQSAQCQQALADCVTRLGGEPGLRCGNLESADLHFQELYRVLPRLMADHERLIAKYRLACERVAGDEASASIVSRFLSVHEQELQSLASERAAQLPSQCADN